MALGAIGTAVAQPADGDMAPGFDERLAFEAADTDGDGFVNEAELARDAAVEQVGQAGMASVETFDRTSGVVHVKPPGNLEVGMMLKNDACKAVRVVIQDPSTLCSRNPTTYP